MIKQQNNKQHQNSTQPLSARKVLLLIAGIPVLIILLSTLMYYLVDSKLINLGTVNTGKLIVPPLRLSNSEIKSFDGDVYEYNNPEPKWTFVVFGGLDCSGSCEKMLYLSRQANIALAKKMGRVRRFYISYEGGISKSLEQQIDQHFKDLIVLSMNRESIEQLFTGSGVDPFLSNRIFVVDERGWLMMYYTAENVEEHSLNALGKDVLKDMKRLIK